VTERILVPIKKGDKDYHLYTVSFEQDKGESVQNWRIANDKSDFIDYTGISDNLIAVQKNYFTNSPATRIYDPLLARGHFVIKPLPNIENDSVTSITGETNSIILGLFLAALLEIRHEKLKDDWDFIVVTGDIRVGGWNELEPKGVDLTDLKQKKKAFDKYAPGRNLFLYVHEEESAPLVEEAKEYPRIKAFRPAPDQDDLGQIIDFVFKSRYGRLLEGNDFADKKQEYLIGKFEAAAPFDGDFVETSGYLDLRKRMSFSAAFWHYYIYGEGKRGKSLLAAELSRHLVRTRKVYAPIWLKIDNQQVNQQITGKEKEEVRKFCEDYLLSLACEYLEITEQQGNKGKKALVRFFLKEKPCLVILDDLRLPEYRLDCFMNAACSVFNGINVHILFTGRTKLPFSQLNRVNGFITASFEAPVFFRDKAKDFFYVICKDHDECFKKIRGHENSDLYNEFFDLLNEWFGPFPSLIQTTDLLLSRIDVDLASLVNLFKEKKLAEEEEIRRVVSDIYEWLFDESNLSINARKLLLVLSGPDYINTKTIKAKLKNKNTKNKNFPQDILRTLRELDYYLLLESKGEGEEKGYKAKSLVCLYGGRREKFPDRPRDAESGNGNRQNIPDIPQARPADVKQPEPELSHVPAERETQEPGCTAEEKPAETPERVPEKFPDRPRDAESVPKRYLIAVEKTGWALADVPVELRTPELCLVAVKKCGILALEYVPEELKTLKICRAAVKNNRRSLQYVPERLRTEKLCRVAINEDGLALEYVPENFKTLEICLAAVRKDRGALSYVPKRLKTEQFYKDVIAEDYLALKYVPKILRVLEFFRTVKKFVVPE
jgi:hypothetical protein